MNGIGALVAPVGVGEIEDKSGSEGKVLKGGDVAGGWQLVEENGSCEFEIDWVGWLIETGWLKETEWLMRTEESVEGRLVIVDGG